MLLVSVNIIPLISDNMLHRPHVHMYAWSKLYDKPSWSFWEPFPVPARFCLRVLHYPFFSPTAQLSPNIHIMMMLLKHQLIHCWLRSAPSFYHLLAITFLLFLFWYSSISSHAYRNILLLSFSPMYRHSLSPLSLGIMYSNQGSSSTLHTMLLDKQWGEKTTMLKKDHVDVFFCTCHH